MSSSDYLQKKTFCLPQSTVTFSFNHLDDLEHGDRVYTAIVSVDDVLNVAVFQQIFDSKEEFDEANFFDYFTNNC